MEKRIFGRTGLEVTVIGFGGLSISGFYGPVDDGEGIRALHAAIDGGMNFIDTSDAYGAGHSEVVIGKFLKERPDRDRILLCTKGGNNMVERKQIFTPEYIKGCVERSLTRLGVEAFDLYLLHNPTVGNMTNRDSFDLLNGFVKEGKIKHWGVTVNTLPECELAVSSGEPSVMQMEYNLLNQEPEPVFKKAKAAGVGVIARVPLMRGFLSGRFKEGHDFGKDDIRGRILSPEKMKAFEIKLDKIREVARDLGKSELEVAIGFCVSNRNVSTVIPGIRTAAQAKQLAACGDPLPQKALERLHQL